MHLPSDFVWWAAWAPPHFQPPPCHDKKKHRGNQWILGHPHPLFVWCANPAYRCSHIIIAYIYDYICIWWWTPFKPSLYLPLKPQCRSLTIGMINIRTGSDLASYPFPHSYEIPPNGHLDLVLDLFLLGGPFRCFFLTFGGFVRISDHYWCSNNISYRHHHQI